jgi:glycosyltransferase involved in cell wall biosynthesis
VHANSLKAGLYGTTAARLCGIPAVWHVHDRIASDYLPPKMVSAVRAAARSMPTAVIANSNATRATLPVAKRCFVVPNAVEAVTSLRDRDESRPYTVGMLGRVAPWKGQHVFVKAFAKAFPDGPERATVVGAPLFGSDEEAYLERVRALGERLGLNGRLVFAGFRDDVQAELASLDVLVHASITPEPFGQVIVEGMAAGLPVVATAAGGPCELIEDGVDGFLVPPNDTDALAETLIRLSTDPALRTRVGEAARGKALQFAPEQVSLEVVAVYSEVLSERRS